jgi:uncharacterized protein (TIGR03085 family)
MTSPAAAERAALCDLLDRLGPDRPTLCAGWTTYDLAAHLAARDRMPLEFRHVAPAVLTGRRPTLHDPLKARHPFTECVAMVRAGAPGWSPLGLPGVREAANLVEYAVHHEDARRAQPDWAPRELRTELADKLWSQLRLAARLLFRRAKDGVVLVRAGTGGAERIVAHGGDAPVTLTGEPLELLLYGAGRRSAAEVDVSGDSAAVDRLAATKLAL